MSFLTNIANAAAPPPPRRRGRQQNRGPSRAPTLAPTVSPLQALAGPPAPRQAPRRARQPPAVPQIDPAQVFTANPDPLAPLHAAQRQATRRVQRAQANVVKTQAQAVAQTQAGSTRFDPFTQVKKVYDRIPPSQRSKFVARLPATPATAALVDLHVTRMHTYKESRVHQARLEVLHALNMPTGLLAQAGATSLPTTSGPLQGTTLTAPKIPDNVSAVVRAGVRNLFSHDQARQRTGLGQLKDLNVVGGIGPVELAGARKKYRNALLTAAVHTDTARNKQFAGALGSGGADYGGREKLHLAQHLTNAQLRQYLNWKPKGVTAQTSGLDTQSVSGLIQGVNVASQKLGDTVGHGTLGHNIFGNLVSDAVAWPVQGVTSTVQLGDAALHPTTKGVAFLKGLAQQVEHPIKSLEEHPLYTAALLRGGLSLIGRGAGAAGRLAGGNLENVDNVASWAKALGSEHRPGLEIQGSQFARDYSRDAIVKGGQVLADRRLLAKAVRDEQATRGPDHPGPDPTGYGNPMDVYGRTRPTIRKQVSQRGYDEYTRRYHNRLVDTQTSIAKTGMQATRGRVAHEIQQAQPVRHGDATPTARTRDVFKAAVDQRISTNPLHHTTARIMARMLPDVVAHIYRPEREIQTLVSKGILRTPKTFWDDLAAYREHVQSELRADDARPKEAKQYTPQQRDQADELVGNLRHVEANRKQVNVRSLFDARPKLAKLTARNEQGTLDAGLMDEGQVKAKDFDYAMFHMKAQHGVPTISRQGIPDSAELTQAGRDHINATSRRATSERQLVAAQKIEAKMRGRGEVLSRNVSGRAGEKAASVRGGPLPVVGRHATGAHPDEVLATGLEARGGKVHFTGGATAETYLPQGGFLYGVTKKGLGDAKAAEGEFTTGPVAAKHLHLIPRTSVSLDPTVRDTLGPELAKSEIGRALLKRPRSRAEMTVNAAEVDTILSAVRKFADDERKPWARAMVLNLEGWRKAIDKHKGHAPEGAEAKFAGGGYGVKTANQAVKEAAVKLENARTVERAAFEHHRTLRNLHDAHVKRQRGANAQLLDEHGNPLSAEQIHAHMRANGVNPDHIAYIPDTMAARGSNGSFYQRLTLRRRGIQTGPKTGSAVMKGAIPHDFQHLAESIIGRAVTLEAIRQHDHAISEHGMRKPNGDFYTPEEVHYILENNGYDASNHFVGKDLVGVTAFNSKIHDPALVAEAQSGTRAFDPEQHLLHAHFSERILDKDQPIKGNPKTPNMVLMPKAQAERYLAQAQPGEAAPTLNTANQMFRRTVLPFSTKWLFGNTFEAALRAAVAGVSPADFVHAALPNGLPNKVFRELLEADARAGHGVNADPIIQAAQDARTAKANVPFTRARRVRKAADVALEAAAPHATAIRNETIGGLMYGNPSLTRHLGSGNTLAGQYGHTAATLPVVHELGVLLKGVTNGIFHGNASIEHFFEKATFSKYTRNEMRRFGTKWHHAILAQDVAVKQAAKGLLNTPEQLKAARYMQEVLGKYSGFGPDVRKVIQRFMPFLPWYLNSARFVFHTLPVRYPVVTAVIAQAERQFQQDWEEQHKGVPKGSLRTAVKTSNGFIDLARYTPFGFPGPVFGGDVGAAISPVLPQLTGLIRGVGGQDPFGKPLKTIGPDGKPHDLSGWQLVEYLANQTAEEVVPGLALTRRLREHGETADPLSTALSIKTKPGSAHGRTAFGRVFNPLSPVYLPKNAGRKGSTATKSRRKGGGGFPFAGAASSSGGSSSGGFPFPGGSSSRGGSSGGGFPFPGG